MRRGLHWPMWATGAPLGAQQQGWGSVGVGRSHQHCWNVPEWWCLLRTTLASVHPVTRVLGEANPRVASAGWAGRISWPGLIDTPAAPCGPAWPCHQLFYQWPCTGHQDPSSGLRARACPSERPVPLPRPWSASCRSSFRAHARAVRSAFPPSTPQTNLWSTHWVPHTAHGTQGTTQHRFSRSQWGQCW